MEGWVASLRLEEEVETSGAGEGMVEGSFPKGQKHMIPHEVDSW